MASNPRCGGHVILNRRGQGSYPISASLTFSSPEGHQAWSPSAFTAPIKGYVLSRMDLGISEVLRLAEDDQHTKTEVPFGLSLHGS